MGQDYTGNCIMNAFDTGPFYHYWTADFGSRDLVFPIVIDREVWATEDSMAELYIYGDGWAQEMRLSNDGVHWTEWQNYQSSMNWDLGPTSGVRTVYVELRNGETVLSSNDQIVLGGNMVFADDFESGNADLWTVSVP